MLKQIIANAVLGLLGYRARVTSFTPPAPMPSRATDEVGGGQQVEASGTRAWLDARPEVKAQVDRHIRAGTAYTQITAWLREQGYPHSYRAFWAYAAGQGARRYAPRKKTGSAA